MDIFVGAECIHLYSEKKYWKYVFTPLMWCTYIYADNFRTPHMERIYIREYGTTLYVGLACAVPPTNTNFKPLLLPTQVGMPYINTHNHRTSYFKSTLTFMGPAKCWKWLSAARQKRQILAILQHNRRVR